MRTYISRFFTQGPADVREFSDALAKGLITPKSIVAIIGKTEGNGGVNDFTRELAIRALSEVLAPFLDLERHQVEDHIMMSFSGGTEGVVAPHFLVIWRIQEFEAPTGPKRLAVAVARTRPFRPDEVGHLPMVAETARCVKELMQEAQVKPGDVHFVQIKGAIAPFSPGQKAEPRNNMAYSRGASAIGIALALNEIDPTKVSDEAILQDWDLFSHVASTSAKPGLERSEILLIGNSAAWSGDLMAAHRVMKDIIDVQAIRSLFVELGFTGFPLTNDERQRVVGLFAKAEADRRHLLRGIRHTMLSDDDISDTRYARCVVGTLLVALSGVSACYISTRAEHHGPLGGGPIAMIARTDE